MAELTLQDLIKVPTALLLRALQSKKELKDKTADEIIVMIRASVQAGEEEADKYLNPVQDEEE